MNQKKRLFTLVMAVIAVAILVPSNAHAQNRLRASRGARGRTRSALTNPSRTRSRGVRAPGRASTSSRTRRPGGQTGTPRLGSSSGAKGFGRLAEGLISEIASRHGGGSGYGDFGGFGGYSHRDQYAKAYRDVGIANAVVNLIGIIATTHQQQRQTVAPPRPSGHYEQQRVVLKEAHYETYQAWVPEIYDSRTGRKIGGGYHESRTRLVPEVYGYRDVWVGNGPPHATRP